MSAASKFGPPFLRVPVNHAGRDYCIGPLHGCWDMLRALLRSVEFDPTRDRLFSVGSLIHVGPRSLPCLLLAEETWFFPVLGAGEAYLGERYRYYPNLDFAWLWDGPATDAEFREYADLPRLVSIAESLPLAIEVPLADGRVIGITPADVRHPFDWAAVRSMELRDEDLSDRDQWSLQSSMVFGRSIDAGVAMTIGPQKSLEQRDLLDLTRLELYWCCQPLSTLDLLVTGRLPAIGASPSKLGMRVFLDTHAGSRNGRLTLMDLSSQRFFSVADPRQNRECHVPELYGPIEIDPIRFNMPPDEVVALTRKLFPNGEFR